MTTNNEKPLSPEEMAEEWAQSRRSITSGMLPEEAYEEAAEGYLAGHNAAQRWIPISERLPTAEEKDHPIEWWNIDDECAYPGRYISYDGRRICVESRYNDWYVGMAFSQFSHWRIVTPPAPKEKEP